MNPKSKYRAVAVGVSAGGFKAMPAVIDGLDDTFPLPIFLVQHTRPDGSQNQYIKNLAKVCGMHIKQADEKEKAKGGSLYLAPPNYHLLIETDYSFSLSIDEPVCHSRPSIDVLFESAASVYGNALIAIILSGANKDGSEGIQFAREAGALTLAQNPENADSKVMPLSAIQTGCVDRILDLPEINKFLRTIK